MPSRTSASRTSTCRPRPSGCGRRSTRDGAVLAQLAVVLVARPRAVARDLLQRVEQLVDVLRRGAEPEARTHRARQHRLLARSQRLAQLALLARGDVEQASDQRVRAE